MNRAWKRFLTVSVVAAVLVTSMASLAFADPDKPKGPAPQAVLAYIAGKTNADMKTLMEEFKGGMTLKEICAAHGVDWSLIEALFMPGKENKEKNIERLEKRIANLLERQSAIQEHIAKMEEAIAKLEARIPEIKNETLKDFAVRHLEILKARLNLANQQLQLVADELALARDELEYVKSL